MGLLTSLLNQHHSDKQQEASRQHDLNRLVMTDPRSEADGGPSVEARNQAVKNMVELNPGTKKHAGGLVPFISGLIGIHHNSANGGGKQASTQAATQTGLGQMEGGGWQDGEGKVSAQAPQSVATPSTIAGTGPVPTPDQPTGGGGGWGFGNVFPSNDQRMALQDREADVATARAARGNATAARSTAQIQREIHQKRLEQLQSQPWYQDLPAPIKAQVSAQVGYDVRLPAPASTQAKNYGVLDPATGQPVIGADGKPKVAVANFNPKTQAWTAIDGSPIDPKTMGDLNPLRQPQNTASRSLDDALKAKADKLGKQVSELTAQERLEAQKEGKDATAVSSSQLRTLAQAERDLTSPDPNVRAAATAFKDQYVARTALIRKNIARSSSQPMDADTLDFLYDNFAAKGGTIPTGLFARDATKEERANVFHEMAVRAKAEGTTTGDMLSAKGERQAAISNYAALNKQLSAVTAYSSFVNKQLARAEKLSVDARLTKSPLWNTALIEWKQKVSGDPKMGAYMTQIIGVQTEIARLLSSPQTIANVPEGSRQEWAKALAPNASPATILAIARVIKQDANDKHDSLRDEIGAVSGEMRQTRRGTATPAAEKMVDVISPEGSPGQIPASKVAAAKLRGFKVK